MRKIILILAALCILFSCSSEDNPVNNTSFNNTFKISDIIYECKIGDVTMLYSMNSFGTEKEVIPLNIKNPTMPRFSPDNSMISYYTIENSQNYLHLCPVDSNDIISFSLFDIENYSWLYDNSMIAATIKDFSSDKEMIILIDTDSDDKMIYLTEGSNPVCSPVNNEILYYKNVGIFKNQLNIIQSDGSGPITLTETSIQSYAWSADGKRIIFSTWEDEKVCIINKDGTGNRVLCSDYMLTNKIQCSPNNDYALCNGFELSYFGSVEKETLYIINLDGSGRKEIVSSPGGIHNFVISPDGSEIAYSISDAKDAVIYIYNVEYTNKTLISDPGMYSVIGDWK